ncbi:MAG: S1 RNA-binding domain-containing protein, partial [Thermoanaerobaculia bacterium]|nr:S1 RNA-binding domain-containing protein [Thermoanaerobaculia bacterium]
YEGEVVNITKFGAFVNILPGRDGLLHISKIGGNKRIDNVEDVYSLGDKIQVVVREIDDRGKVSLDLAGADQPSGDGESAPKSEGNGDQRERSSDRGRDRKPRERRDGGGRDRGGDGGGTARQSKPGRTVVSFEEEFESGM